ncbi:MAG TPA: hypothetical protein VNN62_10255 [Methylomirabilota bacterium]|nr:hypothetical protein [Methylomirabilota bacterium]
MPKPATTRHMKSPPRPALSPFLYDLSAAMNDLPPAAVLPEQFYGSPVNTARARGEVALMRAVLEDAIDCLRKQSRKSGRRAQRLAQEAEEWLFDNDQRWPFSFVNICHVLGIDPEYIRRGLKQRRQEPATPGLLPIAA